MGSKISFFPLGEMSATAKRATQSPYPSSEAGEQTLVIERGECVQRNHGSDKSLNRSRGRGGVQGQFQDMALPN